MTGGVVTGGVVVVVLGGVVVGGVVVVVKGGVVDGVVFGLQPGMTNNISAIQTSRVKTVFLIVRPPSK